MASRASANTYWLYNIYNKEMKKLLIKIRNIFKKKPIKIKAAAPKDMELKNTMRTLIVLLAFISCTSQIKQPERTVIYIHPNGNSTVFYKTDSIATVVNLNPDGELMDSTWMITDKPLDSIIKYYK